MAVTAHIRGQTLVRSLDVEVERADTLRFTVLLDCRPHTALGYDAKPVWRWGEREGGWVASLLPGGRRQSCWDYEPKPSWFRLDKDG